LGHDEWAVRARWMAVGLAGVFTALYVWAAPSLAYQHWDSLEYGFATDSRGPNAIWGNHPLGHVLQRGVYTLATTAGYDGHALPVLKAISGVAGGIAVGAFFALLATLRRIGGVAATRLGDVGWACLFGGAYGFWRFSGTADIYSIAAAALIVTLTTMLIAVTRGSVLWCGITGALAAVATLSHQLTGVLLAATALGLLPLWRRHGSRTAIAGIVVMAASSVSVLIAGYALFGWLALHSLEPSRILAWAKGYSGDPTYGRYLTLLGLSHAVFASTDTLARHTDGAIEMTRRVLLGAGLIWLLVFTWRLGRLPADARAIARAILLQCGVGWALVIWWEPGLVGKFWLLLLPGFLIWCRYVLAVTPGLSSRGLVTALPVAAGLIVLAYNWTATMSYERRPNEVFERSLNLWIAHSRPDDVLVETGRFTGHLLFWGRRAGTANVYRLQQEGHNDGDPYAPMRELFDRTKREGRDVIFAPGLSSYFTDDRLSVVGTTRADLEAFFDSYRWEGPLFEYQEDYGHPTKQAFRLQ
jgi:hypothetical protein